MNFRRLAYSVAILCSALLLPGCLGRLMEHTPPPAESKLEHVTAANFDARVLQAPCPVLVDFYADWCHPCQQLGPILEEIADERHDIRVLKVNVDQNQELCQKFQVQGIPQLFLFRDGQVVGHREGFQTKSAVLQLIGPPVASTAAAH